VLTSLARGVDVCLSVVLLEGLVLSRSVFKHSINYRSVVIFGKPAAVEDEAGKVEALRLFSEHMLPGRWRELRDPKPIELKATLVMSLPIEEASAKVRTGPPIDDEEDLQAPVWAGVVPLALRSGDLRADSTGIEPPDYVTLDQRFSAS